MKVISLKSKEEWKKKRQIGGTDLCAIVNGKGRWHNIIDVYERIVLGKEKTQESVKTKLGTLAERHIRSLFLLQHSELKVEYGNYDYLLVISDLSDYLTLSPDTIVSNRDTNALGFVEIKYKEISNENLIADYLLNLKEKDPQYYWQIIDYFIKMERATFGYLVVAFVVKHKGVYQKTIIDSLRIDRDLVKEDIDLGTSKLLGFVHNNIEKKQKPFFEKGDLEIWENFMS